MSRFMRKVGLILGSLVVLAGPVMAGNINTPFALGDGATLYYNFEDPVGEFSNISWRVQVTGQDFMPGVIAQRWDGQQWVNIPGSAAGDMQTQQTVTIIIPAQGTGVTTRIVVMGAKQGGSYTWNRLQ